MRGFTLADFHLENLDVRWKKGYRKPMKLALRTAKRAKREARRKRNDYLYRELFNGTLSKDKDFRRIESVVLGRIDDVRFLAARDLAYAQSYRILGTKKS